MSLTDLCLLAVDSQAFTYDEHTRWTPLPVWLLCYHSWRFVDSQVEGFFRMDCEVQWNGSIRRVLYE